MAESEEPAAKKVKHEDSNTEDAEDDKGGKVQSKQNAEGESYFEISSTRRATVRTYKGKVMVDIREFYGESPMKPGKKGITLSLEQYNMLRSLILSGDIDKEIKKLGK